MNPNPTPNITRLTKDMDTDADLDLLLQAHLAAPADHLTPSSGFALSVMESIHQQATEPSPIAFPWRRVVPGIAAILFALAAFVLFIARTTTPVFSPTPASAQRSQLLIPSAFSSGELVLVSILLAACISIAAVAASFRLAGRSR